MLLDFSKSSNDFKELGTLSSHNPSVVYLLHCVDSYLIPISSAMSPAPSVSSPSRGSIELEKEKTTPSPAPNDVVHQHDTKEERSSEDLRELDTLSKIATSDFPHGFKLAFIIMALVLSIFLVALDMTIVATAIPRITDEFHSLNQVGWYGSAFFLTVGSFQSTWGKAYKYFPLKPSFLAAIGIFELGSLICGVAQNSITLIIGRAIAGKSSRPRLLTYWLTKSRFGWSRHRLWCIYHHRICGAARKKGCVHRHPRRFIWMR